MKSVVKQSLNFEGVGRSTGVVGDSTGLLAGTSFGRSSEPLREEVQLSGNMQKEMENSSPVQLHTNKQLDLYIV